MRFVFDIEVYKNFFSLIAINVLTGKKYVFVTFENRDDRAKLKRFLSTNPVLIGYNSYDYDIPVLSYFLTGASLSDTFEFSSQIIKRKHFAKLPTEYYRMRDNPNLKGIDLMRVLSLDGIGVSLKQCGILLKWKLLQELPISPETLISKENLSTLLDYNENDVLMTLELYKAAIEDIKLREFISQEYQVDVMNNSESYIANDLITHLYARETNQHPMMFREKRTERDIIPVADCIGGNIDFVSPKMQKFLSEFKTKSITPKDQSAIQQMVKINNTEYQMGVGGLHSIDKPGIFKSTEDKILIDADVSSFYPYIMLNNQIKPAHLENCFLDILRRIVEQRIDYKRLGDTLRAYTLKIVINAIFGKLGCETFWLYDMLAFYSVTISGQLYLLSLVDMLENKGIEVISANTDGVVAYFDRSQLDKYYQICEQWQQKTNFDLEFTEYEKYVRRDVNSYGAKTTKGKVKVKGAFEDITTIPFNFGVRKRYNMPIVQKSIQQYFFNDVPIKDTIQSSQSIHDFLITQKPGKKFTVEFEGEEVQRINRYFVSTNGGYLQKSEKDNPERKLSLVAEQVQLANNIKDDSIENYPNLDYNYYIHEVQKIVDKIQPPITKSKLF